MTYHNLTAEVAYLRARVAELEAELTEARRPCLIPHLPSHTVTFPTAFITCIWCGQPYQGPYHVCRTVAPQTWTTTTTSNDSRCLTCGHWIIAGLPHTCGGLGSGGTASPVT